MISHIFDRKITRILLGVIILLFTNVYGQVNNINYYIENPSVFSENQTATHVPIVPYSNLNEALENNKNSSKNYLSLNGKWFFNWSINPEESPKEFYKNSFDASTWKTIKVPSVWQTEGYGHSIYRNIPTALYPYDPPNVPDDINPVGSYKKEFSIPDDWNGKEIFLHFEGVKSASFVWVNGKYVGYDQGSMTPAEYNVTKFVKSGKNNLSVKVIRWCDGSYLEDQDMWRFSGIYRSVYLFTTPKVHIRDFFIKTNLDENYKDATLLTSVSLKNYGKKKEGKHTVHLQLFNKDGKLFAEEENIKDIEPGKEEKLEFRININNPLKWSDEKPNLYTLTLTLKNSENKTTEILSSKVGFREIEIIDGQLCINGIDIEIRGVNRHEHDPNYGRSVPSLTMLKDIELMKKFNVNAVRLSHYPNDSEFYDLTDKHGIYLQDEVNIETHFASRNLNGKTGVNWFPNNPVWEASFMDRFERMIQRDKNHPSVIMWSTGNEAGLGKTHFKMAEFAKSFDGTRVLMHQAADTRGDAPFAEINGPRYVGPAKLKTIALKDDRPIVMGEYSHAMGNSLGHFDEYWDMIRSVKNLQGGFIWDWVDQGLEKEIILTHDNSKFNISSTLMGNPKVVDGKYGKAIALSGLDDWIEVYDNDSLDITGNQLTVEAWVYPGNWVGSTNPLVTKGTNQFALEQTGEDKLAFNIHTNNNVKVSASLPKNWVHNWHHVAGIYDGAEIKLVIDGEIIGTKKQSGNINRSYKPINIGKNATVNHSNNLGRMSNSTFDNVRIYKRALSLNELGRDNNEPANDVMLSLNFDEYDSTGNDFMFYGADNFCANGVINSDRTVQPETWQMKKSHAPIRIEEVDLKQGKFNLSNYFSFTNLKELNCSWKVESASKVLQNGKLNFDIPPKLNKIVSIPFTQNNNELNEELFLTISFAQKENSEFLKEGHEIYFEQFPIPVKYLKKDLLKLEDFNSLSVDENKDEIKIIGKDFEYNFNKTFGLNGILFNGKQLLKKGIELDIWRAPIDNELSDWEFSEANLWREYNFDKLEKNIESIKIVKKIDKEISVEVKVTWIGKDARRDVTGFESVFNYAVLANGELIVDHSINPLGDFGWFAKAGLKLKMPGEFENFEWYGRGPFETYPDRKTGAKIGVFKGKVSEQYFNYLKPQDSGNKTDVRWATLVNNNGVGLAFMFEQPMNVAAIPYDANKLERALYEFQLVDSDEVNLAIDYKVSGVGGTPIPTRVKYRTNPIEYQYSIRIKPFDRKKTSPKVFVSEKFK